MQSKSTDQEAPESYFDQVAFNYTPSQFATSYAGSLPEMGHKTDHGEDGQSKASFYTSYNAEIDENRQVRKERGRDFNMLSETYSLPTDVNEWDRLDKQHRAISLGLGGLYPAPEVVRAVLAPQEGVTKRILDLGCGTGIWSTEMAREFPHCEVLGIDLAPVPLQPDDVPPNCQFEMDDISLGLTHLQGRFDVVFARTIALGLKDFQQSLVDIETCAKPGGILIWIDADFDIYSGWPITYRPSWTPSNPKGSYLQRITYEVRRTSASLLGSDVKTMEKTLDEGLWTNTTVLDPNTCKAASLYVPIGTWCDIGNDSGQNEMLRYVGMLMRQDLTEGSYTAQPLLTKAGWSKATVERWGERVREECQKDTLLLRFRIVWGRRRKGPKLPAPEIAPVKEATEGPKYPLYEVYETPDQASEASAIRNRGKDIPPPPLASESTD